MFLVVLDESSLDRVDLVIFIHSTIVLSTVVSDAILEGGAGIKPAEPRF